MEEKLSFKPHSTSSETHKRVTLGVADRISRSQKIRLIPAAQIDPEKQKMELIEAEEKILNETLKSKLNESKNKTISADDHDSLFDDEINDIETKLNTHNQSDDSNDLFN